MRFLLQRRWAQPSGGEKTRTPCFRLEQRFCSFFKVVQVEARARRSRYARESRAIVAVGRCGDFDQLLTLLESRHVDWAEVLVRREGLLDRPAEARPN